MRQSTIQSLREVVGKKIETFEIKDEDILIFFEGGSYLELGCNIYEEVEASYYEGKES